MSLTAEALKLLGSEAAEGVAQEKKDWDAVSASANEALHGIEKKAISEVKNFPHPPEGVKDVFQAVAICLGEPAHDWKDMKKMMGDMKFLQRMKDFNPSTIDAKMLKQLKPLVESDVLNPEVMVRKSCAATGFCIWLRAVYEYGSDQAL